MKGLTGYSLAGKPHPFPRQESRLSLNRVLRVGWLVDIECGQTSNDFHCVKRNVMTRFEIGVLLVAAGFEGKKP